MPTTEYQSIFTNLLNNMPAMTDTTVDATKTAIANQMSAYDSKMNANLDNLKYIAGAQNTTYTIVKNESERLASKKLNVDQAIDGQNRMITLNDSYVKRYSNYNQIIMLIVLIILVILGTNLLRGYIEPFIPSGIIDFLVVLVVGISVIIIFNMYISIHRRDTLYFDKLNIPAPTYKDISNIDLVDSSGNRGNWLASGACFGPGCCQDPSQFIYSVGKCVNPPVAIYDYTAAIPGFKTAYDEGAGAISLPAGKTIATLDASEKKSAEWNWSSDNNRWENSLIGANGSYWDIALKQIKDRPVLPAAPRLPDSFVPTMSNSVSTLDNFESGYQFYK